MKSIVLYLSYIIVSLINFVSSDDENWYYYMLGHGASCVGNGTEALMGIVISYDISAMYSSEGWGSYADMDKLRYYQWTICGQLGESTCEGDWCFEVVNKTNETECLEGLSRWEESLNTSISYYAMFFLNDTTVPEDPIGLHVQIAEEYQKNKVCPNDLSFINYNLQCSSGSTMVTSLYENYTECVWNVTYLTPYGCLEWKTIVPNPGGGSSSSNKLSGGSVFVIIVVVLLLTYLILGCAYNSFYHGRVGCDAVPNKNGWIQLGRYTKAGCGASKDCLCCEQGNVGYQNL